MSNTFEMEMGSGTMGISDSELCAYIEEVGFPCTDDTINMATSGFSPISNLTADTIEAVSPDTTISREDDSVSEIDLGDIGDDEGDEEVDTKDCKEIVDSIQKTFFGVFNFDQVEEEAIGTKVEVPVEVPVVNNRVRTLKRKVMDSTQIEFCTKLSQRKGVTRPGIVSERSVKRRKPVSRDIYNFGSTTNPVPPSRGRRLLQIIHAVSKGGCEFEKYFDKIPLSIQELRKTAVSDAIEHGVLAPVDGGNSFLRVTFQTALCGSGRAVNDLMVPFIQYILQEQYTSPECMDSGKIQSLLGQICKENGTISREFPRFSFRKLGGSKVSNVTFDITC